MKFEEAIILLRQGKKICRPDWETEEYVELKEGYLYFENGEKCGKVDYNIEDWEEYKEWVLEDEEKDFLSYAVQLVKSFKETRILYIEKNSSSMNCEFEYVRVGYESMGIYTFINTPYFKKGTMFNKLELNKAYSPKELELD